MRKSKRIDEILNIPLTSKGEVKKKKEKSAPPRSKKEAEKIFDCLWDINPVLSLCSQMQAVTGLRYSDASWLRFNDFLDDNGECKDHVFVIQQKVFNMMIFSGKTTPAEAMKKSTVQVFVNDTCKEVLKECRLLNPKGKYLFANKRSSYLDENGEVQERPMSVQSANEHHLNVRKRLGLKYQLGTHSWRAFFATNLVGKDASIYEIRDLLGHSSVASTDNYLHSIDSRLQKLVLKMNLG